LIHVIQLVFVHAARCMVLMRSYLSRFPKHQEIHLLVAQIQQQNDPAMLELLSCHNTAQESYSGCTIGEMKSYPSFSRSPCFTASVSIRHAFGGFARKPSGLLEIVKWSNTSLPHRKHVQNIFVKPLKQNFISTGRSGNFDLQIPP
jgi:hypothetical protein